jgi:hypothetical protein
MSEPQTKWVPVSEVAKEYSKHPNTIKRWAAEGFILHLGFRVMKDPKGRWLLSRTN